MTKLTSAELKDLQAAGYVEGSATFPDNISPVLRAKALEAWKAKQDGPVTSADLPTAVDRQNERERERLAAEGDVDMQKATGVSVQTPEGQAKLGKADPLDHDANGRKGGVKRQTDAAN